MRITNNHKLTRKAIDVIAEEIGLGKASYYQHIKYVDFHHKEYSKMPVKFEDLKKLTYRMDSTGYRLQRLLNYLKLEECDGGELRKLK